MKRGTGGLYLINNPVVGNDNVDLSVVMFHGNLLNDLLFESEGDFSGGNWQIRNQSIVKSHADSDSGPLFIKGDTRNDRNIDAVNGNRLASAGVRFKHASGARN